MKTLLFVSLLVSHIALAQFSISNLVTDFATGDAEKLCSKRAKVDQPKCHELIKGKRFRKEFLSVCFEVHKKFGADKSFECLEQIANKNTQTASREQAKLCELLVAGNNPGWVNRCLKTNVNEEFAEYCANFSTRNEKNYKSSVYCVEALDGKDTTSMDMKHFRGGCATGLAFSNFEAHANCLYNAEGKMDGGSTIRERVQQSINTQQ